MEPFIAFPFITYTFSRPYFRRGQQWPWENWWGEGRADANAVWGWAEGGCAAHVCQQTGTPPTVPHSSILFAHLLSSVVCGWVYFNSHLVKGLLPNLLLIVCVGLQDLPNAMNAAEITDKLGLHSLRQRNWYIQATCATSGDGLYEGLDWLSNQLKNAKWSRLSCRALAWWRQHWSDCHTVFLLFHLKRWTSGQQPLPWESLYCMAVFEYFWMCEWVSELSGSRPAVPWTQLTPDFHSNVISPVSAHPEASVSNIPVTRVHLLNLWL